MYKVMLLIFLALSSFAMSPTEIRIPSKLMGQLKSFETSGALYLPDLDRYLVASDDTTKKDDPWLFLMDSAGYIEESPVVIKGVSKMTDMESISQDENGYLYIMSSQGVNKNGKVKPERNLFVKAIRQGRHIQAVNIVELRPLLLQALKSSPLKSLDVENELDIESHFVAKDQLFVGLKGPQANSGVAMILSLGSVDKIFNEARVEKVVIAAQLDFSKISGNADLLSEIQTMGSYFLLTTTSENNEGRLWMYDLATKQLSVTAHYQDVRPEGMAFDPKSKTLTVFFDQGDEASLFQRLQVQ